MACFRICCILVLVGLLGACFGKTTPPGSEPGLTQENGAPDGATAQEKTTSEQSVDKQGPCAYDEKVKARKKNTFAWKKHNFYLSNVTLTTYQDGARKDEKIFKLLTPADRVHLVDMDGDGDLDILSFRQEAINRVMWYEIRLNECTHFVRHMIDKPILDNKVSGIDQLYPTDIDGDGDMDFFVKANKLALFVNEGKDKPFKVVIIHPYVSTKRAIQLGDLDGDGDLDLLFSGVTYARDGREDAHKGLMWFENQDGKGTKWTLAKAIPAKDSVTTARLMKVGDFNGDKALDIVYFNESFRKLIYLENQGKAKSFKEITIIDWPSTGGPEVRYLYARHLEVGDLDGNGKLDLVTTDGHFNIFRWDYVGGEKAFQSTEVLKKVVFSRSVEQMTLVDLDQDGKMDILISQQPEEEWGMRWLQQQDGTWKRHNIPTGHFTRVSRFAIGDYDRDGDLDFVFNLGNGNGFTDLLWLEN